MAGEVALGLAKSIRQLSRVPAQTASAVAEQLSSELEQGYAAGIDPYGQAWAPLRPSTLARGRTPPPLTDTGAMRSASVVSPLGGAGVGFGGLPEYAVYHQEGTAQMARRRVLPDAGLPSAWRAIIAREYRAALERGMAGAA
jgi:hypothetical protein